MQIQVVAAMGVWLGLAVVVTVEPLFAQSRPNILWLSSEDNGPALSDGSTSVEVMAAEALGRFGSEDDLAAALQVLVAQASLDDNDLFTSMLALIALDYLDRRAMSAVETIAALPREQRGMQRQFDVYLPQLLDKILADLEP